MTELSLDPHRRLANPFEIDTAGSPRIRHPGSVVGEPVEESPQGKVALFKVWTVVGVVGAKEVEEVLSGWFATW
jgi:hypothetical protein